jgi:large exoprotein involved in heme utilization and adhesion
VQINTPNLDPTSGLVELSRDVADQSRLIAQACPASRRGDVFIVTGRGVYHLYQMRHCVVIRLQLSIG